MISTVRMLSIFAYFLDLAIIEQDQICTTLILRDLF